MAKMADLELRFSKIYFTQNPGISTLCTVIIICFENLAYVKKERVVFLRLVSFVLRRTLCFVVVDSIAL